MDKIAILVLAFALCGCSTMRHEIPHATINDVAVRSELNSGYRLVAVDGRPVERQKSKVNTVVPYAIITPGNHTLTLEPELGSNNPKTTISANIEEGKHYRFAVKEGNVVVVEDID